MNEGNILDEILLDLFDQAIDSINKKENACNDCDDNCGDDAELFYFLDEFDNDDNMDLNCFNCTNSCDDTCKCKDCEDSEFKEVQFVFIDRVIFNDPATIIIWSDGTKTIAKCESCDTFSKETGFLTCFAKKMMGNTEFHKAMHNYCYDALTEDELRMEREKLRLEKKNANNESAISLDGEKALIDGAETIEPESAKESGSDRNSKKKDDATSNSKTALA